MRSDHGTTWPFQSGPGLLCVLMPGGRVPPQLTSRKGYLPASMSPTVVRPTGSLRNYYREYDEWGRLVRDAYHALEYETTLCYLQKYLPPRGRILDAGGGPGRYTIALARKGYDVVLLDVVPELLERAKKEIQKARITSRVKGILEGSISDLSGFPDRSFDAVLCLGGPLGHLVERHDRDRALREMVRVAKKGAPVFVSVIGRAGRLVNGTVFPRHDWEVEIGLHRKVFRTGAYDGALGFAPCHFFWPEELQRELESAGLCVLESAGLEGIASTHKRELNAMAKARPRGYRAWKRFHLESCAHPAIVANSEHFLVVARRP